MGGPRKELMKKKKGIVATGGMSSKPDANFLELKKKSGTDLQCPYCDRDPFKQRDRLKMHIERHHKEELEKELGGGEGGKKIDAKDAVKMLAQKQKDLLEVKLAEKSKQQSDKAKGIDPSANNNNTSNNPKDRSAKKIIVDTAPVVRASVKQPRTILDEFANKKKDIRKPRYVPQEKKDSSSASGNDSNGNTWICKVVLPDKYKPDSDIVLWMNDAAPSKEEAIQRAATLALARYATNLPLQRLLPHEYKQRFESYEKEEKTRLEKKEQREKRELEMKNRKPKPKRVIPTLHMSEEKRLMVEELLRTYESEESSTFSHHHRSYDDFSVLHETDEEIANPEVEALTKRLEECGFEKSDATIAVKQSKDFAYESALDWLVINIPESRLPAKFAPKAMNDPIVLLNNAKKTAEMSTKESNSVPAKDNGDIRLLWERGYSVEEAENAVKTASASSVSPMIVAYRNRVGPEFTINPEKRTNEDWEDEIVAIESIYGDDNVKKGDEECAISVSVGNKVLVTFTNVVGYPQTAPPLIYLSHVDSSSSTSTSHSSREKLAMCLKVAVATALECVKSESGPCMYSVIDAVSTELNKEETAESNATTSSTRAKATQKLPSSSSSSSSAVPKPRGANTATTAPPLANQQANENRSNKNNARNQLSRAQIEEESARLKDAYDLWQRDFKSNKHSAAYKMQTVRNNLPASESRDKITKLVENNAVVVLSGETGCGKSTQVPQFILEHAIFNQKGGETNIICTQPRRISAIGLAERVANERDEKVGGVVGYSVRLESKTSKETRLLFCTTGILLRRLLSDPTLESVTHVILDEVHERSVDSDVLLLLLRRVVQKRPNLKLVLMSATADADLFADYFQNPSKRANENAIKAVKTSKITIPGFTHPVKEYYLEDVFEETRFLVGQKSKYAKTTAEKKRQLAMLENEEDSMDPNALLSSDDEEDDDNDARPDREVPDSWDVAELDEIVASSKKQKKKNDEDDEDDEDTSDSDDDDAEDWALNKNQAEKKRAAIPKLSPGTNNKNKDNNETTADENMKRRKEEEERERQTELALARKHLEDNYSDDVKRSIQNVDESVMNYELIESALSAIIRKELREGMESIVPKGGKPMERDTYGAFLIFMPGQAEILKLIRVLEQSRLLEVSDVGELDFLPLYGQLSAAEQRRIFQKPRLGVRKIVVATNIAETSVTIDDIRYVIDTGRQKEMRYDSERGLSCLEDCWVSKAQAKQRRGRAGRTTPGACFRLFSRTQFANFEKTQAPEMLRTPLQSLVLNIKSMAPESGTAKETLSLALTPPDENALDLAVQELKDLKAMAIVNNSEEIVTPLGKHLTHMPCDPRLGKMLVYASLLGCLDPMLTIASAMSGRPLFYSPKDNREDAEKKKRAFAVGKSDHLAVVNAFDGWLNAKKRGGRGAERRFCDENYLSSQALEAVLQSRVDFAQILSDLGFVSRNYALRVKRFGRAKDDATNSSNGNKNAAGGGLKDEVDVNSNVSRIIKAALVAGLYPKLVRAQHPVAKYAKTLGGAVEKMASGKEMKYYSRDVGRVFLHPTSVNFNVGKYESTWLVYGDRVQTSKVFVRDCTMVGSYPLLLFGGDLDVKHEQGKLVLDEWCEFNAPAKIGVLARELRKKIDQLLTNKVNSPGPISMDNPIVKAMLTLIESEGM